jgi:signal transduction histidine kinase
VVLPRRLIAGLDEKRLRNFLVSFFLALALPTAALIWQAYSQLKWESFHQYQGDAEELVRRIDARVNAAIKTADANAFADYAFLKVSGEPSANFVQRSPLSGYPVVAEVPGVLGYFQVDANGEFSTPLLPPDGTEPSSLGIGQQEYRDRLRLAQELQSVLADNRLVQSGVAGRLRESVQLSSSTPRAVAQEEQEAPDRAVAATAERQAFADEDYSQQVFDELKQVRSDAGGKADNAVEKDAALEKKREVALIESPMELGSADGSGSAPARAKRKELSALPEPASGAANKPIANAAGLTDLRISTFESEIDPFEFSRLQTGHFVLFRKVWRDGQRYIQGLLLDQNVFIAEILEAGFMSTALADLTRLSVTYDGELIRTLDGRGASTRSYPEMNVAEGLGDSPLYRSRLTAPLQGLELEFSIKHLPPGAGASVLAWVTALLATVFVAGFIALYRTGVSQISLTRQQQDFVSAVSHELKSPLTSIRMYGEMLKEGWADEAKRQSYYEYIHDEAERLSRLISNVLRLAKITRNEPQFDLRPSNVGELISVTASKIANQVERAGFELRISATDDASRASINVDTDCFMQMIINLVDNAIKFSTNAEVRNIDFHCRLDSKSRVIFSIRDYGPGVAKDQMKKIFQLFYRSESELTRETVGTGIGLAIVHQLAVAMDGAVDMINASPGAEFRFWFSQVDPRAPPQQET